MVQLILGLQVSGENSWEPNSCSTLLSEQGVKWSMVKVESKPGVDSASINGVDVFGHWSDSV